MPVDSGHGNQRFCMLHPSGRTQALGAVVYVHPFAEEMNKARRMAAMQARAMAGAGYDVLQIDLLGCGDSSGDFGDATWQDWTDDVLRACAWMKEHSAGPLWLWGLRSGCLLAAEAAQHLGTGCNFLFWAPTPAGKTVWQQFMRLKIAGDLLAGSSKGVMDALRRQTAGGQAVEIAGYVVHPALVQGLEQATLTPPAHLGGCRLEWLDMTTRTDTAISPVARSAQEQWAAAGVDVRHHWVQGPSFWQTTEIEDAPELLAATLAAMQSEVAA